MRIEVISPHGFCGGVDRAIRMANAALDGAAAPIFCLHEIVHNELVVRSLERRGMRFVETLDDVPKGAVVVVSAHGTAPAVVEEAGRRGIRIIDTTCPFVAAAHRKIRENFAAGMRTAIVGEPSHAEVRGYLGEPGACLPGDVRPGEAVDVVVQTTLDSGEYRGVCTATRDRQQAVRTFVERSREGGCVGVLVVGSANSSNTRRLAEVAERAGARAWRVATDAEAERLDFGGIDVLGVTSGASTPEDTLRSVLARLRAPDACGTISCVASAAEQMGQHRSADGLKNDAN